MTNSELHAFLNNILTATIEGKYSIQVAKHKRHSNPHTVRIIGDIIYGISWVFIAIGVFLFFAVLPSLINIIVFEAQTQPKANNADVHAMLTILVVFFADAILATILFYVGFKIVNKADKNMSNQYALIHMRMLKYLYNDWQLAYKISRNRAKSEDVFDLDYDLTFAILIGKEKQAKSILKDDTTLLTTSHALSKIRELKGGNFTPSDANKVNQLRDTYNRHLVRNEKAIMALIAPKLNQEAIKIINSGQNIELLPDSYRQKILDSFVKNV